MISLVRRIEIGALQAVPLLEILVLAWDIIFEVDMCYVSFFTIPHFLDIIKEDV